MAKDQPDQYKGSKPQKDIDWQNRVLCSDGNCIGVIGSDGCCNECGKPYEGKLPWQIKSEDREPDPETASEASEPDLEAASDEDSQPLEEESSTDAAGIKDQKSQEESDWENRRLCSDGNCIGVIGPDDRCKECGKPY